jgi:hypothetical protein
MLRALIVSWFVAGLVFAASAETRYALLIGNEDYPPTVGQLTLPHEDVENMRLGLIQAGFPAENVKVLSDATQTDINLAVAQLSSDLRAAGGDAIGFFYYSGHGGSAESAGRRANYLIPARSPITGAEQLPILGVPVNSIVDALAASDAKAIFIVSDACRNTLPFTSSKGGAADKGMVRVPRKKGLYIAFATADGATTPDDGLFSRALSKRLPQKGLSADRAFTLALREVAAARPGNAMPFTADGLTEDICFAGCGPAPAAAANSEDLDYVTATRQNTVDSYLSFLSRYPKSSFVQNAQEAIVKLFYQEHDSAQKYMEDDLIIGPPALLEAIFHAGEMADLRDEPNSAYLLYQITCFSGFSAACADYADAIRWGYGDKEEFENADGTIDLEARTEAEVTAHQVGCAYGGAKSCSWLDQNSTVRWPSCDQAAGTDAPNSEFCSMISDLNVRPVPSQ